LGDRLARRFAEEIPQRDVDRRIAAHFRAAGGKAEIAGQIAGDAIDGERIAADQFGRRRFVNIGFDGAGAHECLAESDKALVRMHAHPKKIGMFVDADGFEFDDLHLRRSPRDSS
jgi:hypothetical protein